MCVLLVLLPYSILAVSFVLLVRAIRRAAPSLRPFLLYPLVGSFVISMGATIWLHYGIIASRSSTAAVGYISLPFLSVSAAVAGFVVSGSCYCVVRFAVERLSRASSRSTPVEAFILALLILCLCVATVQGLVAQHMRLAAAAGSADPGSLQKMINRAVSSYDLEMLSRLAQNPNLCAADLARIYDICKHSVHGSNAPEYGVFFSLAGNPHTPPDILAVLGKCEEVSIRSSVRRNPATPIETLHSLSKDPDPLVRGVGDQP